MTVGRNSEHFKSFTLPCFSMIATGDCSYENYCKFIHDRRLKCNCRIMPPTVYDRKEMNRRQKNQNATEKGFVVFYWPPMNVEGHQGHYVDRKYHLPVNPGPGNSKDYSYSCMVSMWEHFITYLNSPAEQSIEFQAFGHGNPYTNRPRLPVFRELSLSEVKKSVNDKLESSRVSTESVTPSARSPMTLPDLMSTTTANTFSNHSAYNLSSSEMHLKKMVEDGSMNAMLNDHDELEEHSVVTTSSDQSVEPSSGRDEDLVVVSGNVNHSTHLKQVSSSSGNGEKRVRDNGRNSAKNLRTPRT